MIIIHRVHVHVEAFEYTFKNIRSFRFLINRNVNVVQI